jgi:hypothetical protein
MVFVWLRGVGFLRRLSRVRNFDASSENFVDFEAM